MKRTGYFLSLVVLAGVFLISACGGGSSSGGGTTGSITGSVIGFGGTTGVANSVVKVDGSTVATANGSGWFTASGIATGNNVFCFEGTDKVAKCRTIAIDESITTPITPTVLPPLGTADTIPLIENGGTANDPSGTAAEVVFPVSSVCDSSGTVVTGSVDCYFTPVDVTTYAGLLAGPDSFVAVDATGARGTMVSSGMMSLTCMQSGTEVNICTGKEATVKVPIYSTTCATEDASIDKWSFNDTTGMWELYDGAQFDKTCGTDETDSYYEGNIDHLSWINGDRWVADACLTGTVYGFGSLTTTDPVTITCWGVGWKNEIQVNPTDGAYCIPVPSGRAYSCNVGDNSRTGGAPITGTAPTTTTTFPVDACPASTCATLADISFAPPIIKTTLTWGSSTPASPDLDSHFVTQGNTQDIYFANTGSLTASPWIALDTDDVTYEGPEVTTVLTEAADGHYRFCIINYTGESSGSFYSSAAKVHVTIPYSGVGSVVAVDTDLSAPTTGTTDDYVTWQVYEVQIAGGIVTSYTVLNTMTSGGNTNTNGCWN